MGYITPAAWGYDTAAHLLERAGFGHNGSIHLTSGEPVDVRALYANPGKTPEAFVESILPKTTINKKIHPNDLDRVKADLVKRMWKAPRGTAVREKMVLFLHGHFATQASVVAEPKWISQSIWLYRRSALGDFRQLVKDVTIDNGMLRFLNGDENRDGDVNENYGRELMELLTLGLFDFSGNRNYAQQDVRRAAKVLTGWTQGADQGVFDPALHDTTRKRIFLPVPDETPLQNAANVLDVTDLGASEYAALVDAIFAHLDTEGRPTAARFLVRKLWKFFAYDPEVAVGTPRSDLPLIDELVDVFHNGTVDDSRPYILRNLLKAIFLREELYANAGRTVKSPTEFVLSSIRKLRGSMLLNPRFGIRLPMDEMGQVLLEPPDVKGWDGNGAWLSSLTIFKRLDWAKSFLQEKKGLNRTGFDIRFVAGKWCKGLTTRAQIVDRVLRVLGPVSVSASERDALIAFLGPDDTVVDLRTSNYDFVQARLRGLIHLVLALPNFHVS